MDVPYPVDYGGVFDIFYKIKTLSEAGIRIHLHCFEYGRGQQAALNRYCAEVLYYKRVTGLRGFSLTLPYIVSSRKNIKLLNNLAKDDYPILVEGIHCTALLWDDRFKSRKILLRLFNVEYRYYHALYKTSRSIFKKIYFAYERRLLYRYEKRTATRAFIVALSEQDALVYRNEFSADKIVYLPTFLPFEEVLTKDGTGDFCLFHGNLSVPENESVALWLLKKVFNDLKISLVIAGKKPSKKLSRASAKRANTHLVVNPSDAEMQDLITKAQINILPSFNSTGVKLKLLNALFNGRHCLANEAAMLGTSLEGACHLGTDEKDFKKIVTQLYHHPFEEKDRQLRKFLLQGTYNNSFNAKQLIQWIW